jgi:hypothetical protein
MNFVFHQYQGPQMIVSQMYNDIGNDLRIYKYMGFEVLTITSAYDFPT